jgi:hypothetical protein
MIIARYIPHDYNMKADLMVWKHSTNGNFIIKSVYALQKAGDDVMMDWDPCCSHCLTEVETLLHALCDYPKARRVWESLVKVGERGYFYHHNWYAWLISNLSLSNKDSHDVDWPLKFGIVPWFIWKDRCQRVFGVK